MNGFKAAEVMDFIEANQEKWNQGMWAGVVDEDDPMCGTACCFAGWAALLNGWELIITEHVGYDGEEWIEVDPGYVRNKTTGAIRAISAVGTEELELTEAEADALFAANNTLDDLHDVVKQIANGEIKQYETDVCDCGNPDCEYDYERQ